eukprot:566889-Prymnesium_polylepis.1
MSIAPTPDRLFAGRPFGGSGSCRVAIKGGRPRLPWWPPRQLQSERGRWRNVGLRGCEQSSGVGLAVFCRIL